MTYPEHHRFVFHRNDYSNRRDRDADPRVLFLGMEPDDDRLQFHLAGDPYVRSAHVYDAVLDEVLVAGLAPGDALKLGIAYERARIRARRAV